MKATLAITSADVRLDMLGSPRKLPPENLLTSLQILAGPVEINTTEEVIHSAEVRRERESERSVAFG